VLHNIFVKILWFLPKSIAHKLLFYKMMGQKLNLKNPQTLNEKIQWLIINHYGKKEAQLSDKELVKKYIESLKINDLYIPKTYLTIKEQNNKVNLSKLPERFVLKTNHGSGDVFICHNKKDFNIEEKINILTKLLKKDYSKSLLEYHYTYINPLIMVEEFLDDFTGEPPLDYKFFCFNGRVDYVMVCSERGKNTKKDFYDINWNHLNYSKKECWSKKGIEKPENLEKMFKIASQISQNFPFVRVDLYYINNKIYFGEMTFTPAAGMSDTYTLEGDIELGKFLDISKINNSKG